MPRKPATSKLEALWSKVPKYFFSSYFPLAVLLYFQFVEEKLETLMSEEVVSSIGYWPISLTFFLFGLEVVIRKETHLAKAYSFLRIPTIICGWIALFTGGLMLLVLLVDKNGPSSV